MTYALKYLILKIATKQIEPQAILNKYIQFLVNLIFGYISMNYCTFEYFSINE